MSILLIDFKCFFIGSLGHYLLYDPSPICKKEFLTNEIIQQHLDREITIGTYPIYKIDGKEYCKSVIIDIDFHNEGLTPEQIKEDHDLDVFMLMIELRNTFTIPKNCILRVFSGNGYHIWIKLYSLTEMAIVKGLIRELKQFVKNYKYSIEVFPSLNEIGNGYGKAVKLPLSTNLKNSEFCPILDNFDLSQQGKGYIVPNWINPVKEKHKKSSYEIKIITNKEDRFFYDQLKPCLKALVDGEQALGSEGHLMRIALNNELIYLGSPLETRINAFKNQKDFNYSKVKYQTKSLESGIKNKQHPLISTCSKIRERGYCLVNKFKKCEWYKKFKLKEKEV